MDLSSKYKSSLTFRLFDTKKTAVLVKELKYLWKYVNCENMVNYISILLKKSIRGKSLTLNFLEWRVWQFKKINQ
jgi:hypothetical protein